MVWVPGGSFQMGNDAFANARPEHPVTVKGFWIDKPLGVVLGFYRPDWYLNFPGNNLQGPMDSFDPNEPNAIKRIQRGGSFLCSHQCYNRYKAGSFGKGEVISGSNNLGFQCGKFL